VLVAGAAGGVGHVVVQLATARGARVVATASPANREFLTGLGADRVLDYHGDWMTQARGVDAAFDCVGGPTWEACVQAVRPGGRAVTIVRPERLDYRSDVTATTFSATATTARLRQVAQLLATGQLVLTIAARFALADAAQAHAQSEAGHARGKILLLPG
jgi:NADPH2:quinone reductase